MNIRPTAALSLRGLPALAVGLLMFGAGCLADQQAESPPSESSAKPALSGLDLSLPAGYQDNMILLPDMGASAGNLMTPAQERRLGRQFMRSVRASAKVVDDPLESEYIQDLGNRLVSHYPATGKQFTFFLVDDPQINAFAGPGGYIGVHTGLVLASETESELASVVAHEIAHVTQNHLFRAFDEFSRLAGPAALLTLGAALLGATVSGDAAVAAIAGIQAGMAQAQLNFTRANEEEADREGIKILAQANYDPRAMPVFFGRMAQATRLYETNLPEFLRTHPVTSNRIADAMGRAEAYPYTQPIPDPRYYLLRARLRLGSFKNPADAVVNFRQALEEGRYRDQDAQRYGYALALIRAGDYPEAQKQLDQLLRKQPASIPYLLAQAELQRARGESARAIATLEAVLELYPSNYALTMEYASLQQKYGDPAKAYALLSQLHQQRPDDTAILEPLARSAAATGAAGEAYQYQAEWYYLHGQLEAAVRQLEIALNQPDLDYYRNARLAARLQEYRAELAELKKSQ